MSTREPDVVTELRQGLGALLRERRDATGKTLDALSHALGRTKGLEGAPVSRASLNRYEKGKKTPPEVVVLAILKLAKTDQATTRRALTLLEQIQAAAARPVPPPSVSDDPSSDTDKTPSKATSPTATGGSPSDSDATPPPAIPRGQQHIRLDGHRVDPARPDQIHDQAVRGEADPKPPVDGPPRPVRKSNRWLIPAAVVVVLIVVAALAIVEPWSWQAGAQDGDQGQQNAPSTSKSAAQLSRSCTPPATTEEVTGIPSSTTRSSDSAASAKFYRDQSLVVLIDERKDYHSAALRVKIDGNLLPLFSNCYGKTGVARKDGKIAPPKIISLSGINSDTVVEFMACVAEDATEVIEASCGKWTVDQPR